MLSEYVADKAPVSMALDLPLSKCTGFSGSLKFIIHSREIPNVAMADDSEDEGGSSEFDEPADLSDAIPLRSAASPPEAVGIAAPPLMTAPRQFRPLPQPTHQPIAGSASSHEPALPGADHDSRPRLLSSAEGDSIRQLGARISLLTSSLAERDCEVAELKAALLTFRSDASFAAEEAHRNHQNLLAQLESERKEAANLRQNIGLIQQFLLCSNVISAFEFIYLLSLLVLLLLLFFV